MMVIIEDTRQQAGKHRNLQKYFYDKGISVIRTKLLVGDYSLPLDHSTVVDTKKGMQEVYQDCISDHARFVRELKQAQEIGSTLYILVEDYAVKSLDEVAGWKNPRRERWFKVNACHKAGKMLSTKISKTPPASSEVLRKIMMTLAEKYGCIWTFCKPEETGETIVHILNSK